MDGGCFSTTVVLVLLCCAALCCAMYGMGWDGMGKREGEWGRGVCIFCCVLMCMCVIHDKVTLSVDINVFHTIEGSNLNLNLNLNPNLNP